MQLRRRIGYVIQNVGLFPHQSVRRNVATVPRLLGWDKRRTRDRVEELLTLVGLDPATYGDRYPHQLSGGQRQRAGVVRERLQTEFLRLQDTVRKTIVFVTHDIEEAVRLGDRIAVMSTGGTVEQFASPAELLGSPASPFVADFVGADRGLKRLAVTGIDPADLEHPPVVHVDDGLADARGDGGGVQLAAEARPERRRIRRHQPLGQVGRQAVDQAGGHG